MPREFQSEIEFLEVQVDRKMVCYGKGANRFIRYPAKRPLDVLSTSPCHAQESPRA